MNKAYLLILCGVLTLCACQQTPVPPRGLTDAELSGEKVPVASLSSAARKIFVLNEGGKGSNNASLDFLRLPEGEYITGAFKKVNPEVGAGLGDVGNDIVVRGDEVWMLINNSGIVEVISAETEKEIAAIKVPTPRNIAFDENYAYVTSWAGSFADYVYDEKGSASLSEYANTTGRVYRIDLKTRQVDAKSVEVGYQPEGIACYGGKLYVANSGGISCQVPPNYAYDNTVSIINVASFAVEENVEVQVNLKQVYSDGNGLIYLTTLGNYADVHSGLYVLDTKNNNAVKEVSDYVSVCAFRGRTVYCYGTDQEFDWSAEDIRYSSWKCTDGVKEAWTFAPEVTTPYCLLSVSEDVFLLGDAGDYFNPGTLSCYDRGERVWTVGAGVCPGHIAIWQ